MHGLDSIVVSMKVGGGLLIFTRCITVNVRAVPRGQTHRHMTLGWQLTSDSREVVF